MKKKFNEIFNETVQKKQNTNEAWWDKLDSNQINARYGAFRDNNRRNVGASPEHTETEAEKRQREYFEKEREHKNSMAFQDARNIAINDKISQREKNSLLLDYAQTIKREFEKNHGEILKRVYMLESNTARLEHFLSVLQMIFDADDKEGKPEFRVSKGAKVYDLGSVKTNTASSITVYPKQDYIKDEFSISIKSEQLDHLKNDFNKIVDKANSTSKFKALSDYEKIQEDEFLDGMNLIRRIPEFRAAILRETYEPLASEFETNLIFGDLLENISDINLLEKEIDPLTGENVVKNTKLTTRAGNVNKANELALKAANDPNVDPSTKGRIKNNAIATQTQYNIEKNQINRSNQMLEENDQIEAIDARMENERAAFERKMDNYAKTKENIKRNEQIKKKAEDAANAVSTQSNGVTPAQGNLATTGKE